MFAVAGLSCEKINELYAYTRKIDLNSVITDQYGKTMTNVERIMNGYSPVDMDGIPYELHHVGQQIDSPLAILTKPEHMQGGNNKILHFRDESGVEHGPNWTKQVHEFWNGYLERYGGIYQ